VVDPFDLSDGDVTGVTYPTPAAFPAGISIFHKGTPLFLRFSALRSVSRVPLRSELVFPLSQRFLHLNFEL